tara:strand:+ start:197 stop:391 length:195 start_codon:yes stop_codon:yes gene_type:complete
VILVRDLKWTQVMGEQIMLIFREEVAETLAESDLTEVSGMLNKVIYAVMEVMQVITGFLDVQEL